MQMDINGSNEIRLSLSSLNEYIKSLELKKKQILKATKNIATRVAEEAGKDTYEGVEIIPAKMQGTTAVAYARTTREKDTYQEFGTGLVGSQNPHLDEALAKSGWRYDVNEHGENGWIYPKGNGIFGWTKGQPAKKKFYMAGQRAREKFKEIAKEELHKQKNS